MKYLGRVRNGAGTVLLVWIIAVSVSFMGACSKSSTDQVSVKRGDQQRVEVTDWPQADITVTGSVQLDQRATFEGDIVAISASPITLAHGAEIALENDAILTGTARADTLFLGDRARITGVAAYNSKQGNGTVEGTQTSPLALPLDIQLPNLPPMTPGSQDVSLTFSESRTLGPGSYKNVTLQNGNGGIATRLTLSGGVYTFRRLTLNNDARVECAAACEIRVVEPVSVGARSSIGPGSVQGMGAGNVQLLVKGSGPTAVVLEDNSDLFAYLLAPNGRVTVGHRVDLGGKVVAKHVLLGIDLVGEGLQLPIFEQHPQDVTVWEGQSAEFTVAVTGDDVSLQWQRDGSDISGEADSTLTIESATMADDGVAFRVAATNEAGTVVSHPGVLTVIPCQDFDTECDGIDEDCDGDIDEDFELYCVGTSRFWCEDGVITGTNCGNGVLCDGQETCSAGVCGPGPDPADDGNECTQDLCNEVVGVDNPPEDVGATCLAGPELGVCDGQGTCIAGPDPFVSCVSQLSDGSYSAWFGYHHTGPELEIPHGEHNTVFPPGGGDLFQPPTLFTSGTTERAFARRFHEYENVLWSIGGDVVTASRLSPSCPEPPRAAEVRGFMSTPLGQKPLQYRSYASYRSPNFLPPAGAGVISLPPTAEEETIYATPTVPPESSTMVRIEFLSASATFDDGCGYGEPYAKVGIAGGGLTRVNVPQNSCGVFEGCVGAWSWDPPRTFEISFPADQDTATVEVEVWDEDDCILNGGDDRQGEEFRELDLTVAGTSDVNCITGSDTGLCYQIVVAPGQPPPPQVPGYARLCFEWATNFVDNELGEDKRGRTLAYTEQRFPARHAEYQLQIDSAFGTRSLGAHYDAADNFVSGTQRFLDADGCIEDGLVPNQLLAHRPGAAVDQGGVNFRARVRTFLAKLHTRNDPVFRCAGVDQACRSDADCSGSTCERAQVCDEGRRETLCPTLGGACADGSTCIEQPYPQKFAQSYNITDADGRNSTVVEYSYELGSLASSNWSMLGGYFVPPTDSVRVSSFSTDPLVNTAVALGDILALGDNGFIDTERVPMQVVVGDVGHVDCSLTTTTCANDADCSGAATCGVNKRCGGNGFLCISDEDCDATSPCVLAAPALCGVCNHGSAFDPGSQTVLIGPSERPLDALSCVDDDDCPGAQLCVSGTSGMPCEGSGCFCHWPDQSRWKGVIQHEAGHQLAFLGAGRFGGLYEFDCPNGGCVGRVEAENGRLLDPPEVTDDDCACQHVTAANALHCLQSAERYSAALDEGFGHFTSARANNWQVNPETGTAEEDCTFSYYKEVLSPDLMGLTCGTDVACTTTPRRDTDTGIKAYPPMGVDCGATFNWRDNQCGTNGPLATYATELDFLQFFWAIHGQGTPTERLTMDDIHSTLRAMCSGSWRVCDGDEVLQWASLGGMPSGSVRSLNDGAEAHLGSTSPDKLQRFLEEAANHGLTPP